MNPTRTRRTTSTAALIASVVLHAIVAASVLPAFGTRAPKNAPAVEPRDRWSGAATEVEVGVESQVAAVGAPPGEHQEGTTAPPPRDARARPEQPRKKARPVEPAVDPESALARKILEYRPKGSEAQASAAEPASGSTQSIGGEDASNEKRSLARAFTRALPVANTGDPIWNQLPLGHAGSIVVVLSVDEEGKSLRFEQRDRPRAPPYLVRSVERALLLLRGGSFSTAAGGTARQAFRLDVTVSDRPAESGPLALGYEPPRNGKSGRAYFQLPSGRFVDVLVTLAGS
jgi:hypothetical protein